MWEAKRVELIRFATRQWAARLGNERKESTCFSNHRWRASASSSRAAAPASARAWPSSSFASVPTSRSAAAASRSATRPQPPGGSDFPERRIDTFGVDIRVAQAVEEMVETLWTSGGLTGLVNNAAGNFIAPTESLSPRAFDAIANIVFHGTFYVTQAVGKRWVARRKSGQWQAGAAVSQRRQHRHHLGRQRLALRRALGDEQGRDRHHDQVARGRVGPFRRPPELDRAGRDSRPKE